MTEIALQFLGWVILFLIVFLILRQFGRWDEISD
jgi:hypothetical protein